MLLTAIKDTNEDKEENELLSKHKQFQARALELLQMLERQIGEEQKFYAAYGFSSFRGHLSHQSSAEIEQHCDEH